MGVSKLNLYAPRIRRLSQNHKVLSHPARVQILEHIKDGKAYTCLQFSDLIGLAQSSISDHLEVLKRWEFVKQDVVFNQAYYTINSKKLSETRYIFNLYLKELEAA